MSLKDDGQNDKKNKNNKNKNNKNNGIKSNKKNNTANPKRGTGIRNALASRQKKIDSGKKHNIKVFMEEPDMDKILDTTNLMNKNNSSKKYLGSESAADYDYVDENSFAESNLESNMETESNLEYGSGYNLDSNLESNVGTESNSESNLESNIESAAESENLIEIAPKRFVMKNNKTNKINKNNKTNKSNKTNKTNKSKKLEDTTIYDKDININKDAMNSDSTGKNIEVVDVNAIINKSSSDSRRRMIHQHGYLKLVIGCMYSSKSTDLKNDRNHWKAVKGFRILVINFMGDKRYTKEDMVMTHDKEGFRCVCVDKLSDITSGKCKDEKGDNILPENYDMFMIDEGQFFPDLLDNVIYWTDILKKTVFVYGLSGDFRRKQFGQIMDLIPLCDELLKKKAKCMMCHNGTEAIYTWKVKDNDDKVVVTDIASSDKYVALCRKHYNRSNPQQVIINDKLYSNK